MTKRPFMKMPRGVSAIARTLEYWLTRTRVSNFSGAIAGPKTISAATGAGFSSITSLRDSIGSAAASVCSIVIRHRRGVVGAVGAVTENRRRVENGRFADDVALQILPCRAVC